MKKLSLHPEDLAVESFSTGDTTPAPGTVRAYQDHTVYPCTQTCQDGVTCMVTCFTAAPRDTCYNTCWYCNGGSGTYECTGTNRGTYNGCGTTVFTKCNCGAEGGTDYESCSCDCTTYME